MSQPTNQLTNKSTRRSRAAAVVVAVLSLLLACCLCASLIGNVGTAGWALWINRELRHEQERTAALEARVQQLMQTLQGNDIEVPLAPADVQLMDTIESQVEGLRQLQPLRPVERALMTQEQLRERILQDFEEESSPEEIRDYTLTLAAFDLVDPDIDMYDLLVRLYAEQIAGFYDPETEQLYVIADAGLMGQLERLTYAHEFTHALQDQHFDLEALGLRDDADEVYDDEYLSAIQALVEGDASLTQRRFMSTYYSADDMATLMQESLKVDSSVLDAVPDVLRESLFFPYNYGEVFVRALYDEGGQAAVDAAFANPPVSTEQILHPERYQSGDAPQIVSLSPLTDTLGPGWRLVYEEVWGEFSTRYYLAQQIAQDEAEAAAEGWGGDRYAVHYRESDGGSVLAWRIVWDTPADAEEFVDAYVTFADKRSGHAADVTGGARSCWAGDDYLCLAWGPAETLVVLAPDQAIVESVMDVIGAP
jgi:hypothetical protein